jgi:hypothetical protein
MPPKASRTASQAGFGDQSDMTAPTWFQTFESKWEACSANSEMLMKARFDALEKENISLKKLISSLEKRLAAVEKNGSSASGTPSFANVAARHTASSNNALYCAVVKANQDKDMIDSKAANLMWMGIKEQEDDL